MRAVIVLVAAACGRVGFDAVGASDAPAAASYVATVLADHPIAYYRLDEASGTIAHDASGHGNDARYGVTGGQLGYGQPGALVGDPDAAVELAGDGNNTASVALPAGAFAFAGDFTVEGFVMPAAPPGSVNFSFLGWEKYTVRGFRTGWDPNLVPLLWTSESGGSAGGIEGVTMLSAGVWTHLVFSHAGTALSLYVDGQLAATGALTYVPPLATDYGWLGSDEGEPGGSRYDELAIYDHALSAAQVAAHYAASR